MCTVLSAFYGIFRELWHSRLAIRLYSNNKVITDRHHHFLLTMQLPRGTFHSLKRGIALSFLLEELQRDQFTGYCNLSLKDAPVSLVYRNGTVVLAHIPPFRGTEAEERLQKSMNEVVDAELYTLTENQLRLSLEFNQDYCTRGDVNLPDDPPSADLTSPSPQKSVKPAMPGDPPSRSQGTSRIVAKPLGPLGTIQLPRGKYHSKISDVPLSTLLDDLKNTRFSGTGIISIGEETITIVLDEGITLLAHFPPEQGSAALQLLQMKVEDSVNAELYTLTPAQIKLALEFNREFRVSFSTKTTVIRIKPQKIPEKPLRRERIAAAVTPAGRPAAPLKEAERLPVRNADNFEEQLHAIETMNLKAMEDQFRDVAKDVVIQLNLGHLLEEEGEEDSGDGTAKDEKR